MNENKLSSITTSNNNNNNNSNNSNNNNNNLQINSNIENYHKLKLFLNYRKELLQLWTSISYQNTAFDQNGTIESISSLDIVCRGDPPTYDSNFRQRGVNGDIIMNLRQLYECASMVKSTFDNALIKLAKSLHFKTYVWDGITNEIEEVGLILCPLKHADRATEKINEKYQKIEPGPPESWIYDIVRASFVCNTEQQVNDICETLQNFPSFEVIQIFNHFITPYPSGYRSVVLNIRMMIKNKQGHLMYFICEVAIHHVILRKYYLQNNVAEYSQALKSLFITEDRIGVGYHNIVSRNDNIVSMMEKCIIEVNQVIPSLNSNNNNNNNNNSNENNPHGYNEDFVISQCLVAIAEVQYQQIESKPSINFQNPQLNRLSPTPSSSNLNNNLNNNNNNLPSSLPALNSSPSIDADEESSFIQSWVDLLKFFSEFEWAEKYHKLLLIRILVPRYGEDHLEVAEALDGLAQILHQEGKFAQAIQLYEKSIYVRTRLFGEKHGFVANSLYAMACLMYGQGKYAMALPLHEQVLLIRKQVYGNHHSSVGESLVSLAQLMQIQNKIEASKNFYREAVEVFREVYGDLHPIVATTLNSLATLLDESGQHHEARILYEQSLAFRVSIYGEYHPSVATTLNSLAQCLKKLGEYDEAGNLYARALSIRRKQYGDRHPMVATTLNNLGLQFKKQKKYDEALPLYQEALSIRREVYGNFHEEVAASLNNLALLYDAMGHNSEALKLHEETLQIRIKVLGDNHLLVAETYNNLGLLYKKLNNIPKAKTMFESALKIRLLYGEDNPEVRATQACIAGLSNVDSTTISSLRLYPSSNNTADEVSIGSKGSKGSKGSANKNETINENQLQTSISTSIITNNNNNIGNNNSSNSNSNNNNAINLRIYGREHFLLAMSLRDIGLKLSSEGYINQSKPLLEQSLALLKMTLHENDEEIAKGSTYLADVFKNVGKTSLALKLTKDATKIYRIVYGSCNSHVIQSLIIESTLQSKLSNHDMAKSILIECLSLTQQLYGEEHEEVANVLSALAWVYKYDGDYSNAKKTHEKSLGMRIKLFGENHPTVASSLSDIGDLMEALGKYNDAFSLHEKALTLRQKTYGGERHREVALSHISLGKLYRVKENWEQAKIEFESAGRILSQISDKDPLLATAYNELATILILLSSDGNLDVSIPLFERALDIRVSRYGRIHAETAESMHDIACILSVYPKERVHERALAILFFEDAYRIRRELYSDEIDHPDVVKTLTDLCSLMVEEELWSRCSIYVNHLLDVKRREFPHEDHLDLADAYLTSSLVSLRNSELGKAKLFCLKGMEIMKDLFSESDEKSANSYTLLAEITECEGHPNKARKFHEMALGIRQKIYLTSDRRVAESLESIGQMYIKTKKYEKAFSSFEEALTIRKQITNDRPDMWTAYTLQDCVSVLILNEKYEEAKPYAIEALRLRNILCRKTNSLLVAESMLQLASLHTLLNEYEDATPLLLEALDIRLNELGPLALLVAEVYHLLGTNYQDRGMIHEAEEMYLNALNLHFKVYDEDDSEESANTYIELAQLFHSCEEYDEALTYYFLALEMFIRLFGLENKQVADCLSKMAFTLRKAERFDESRKRYEQASAILINVYETTEHLEIASIFASMSSLAYYLKDYEEALTLSKQVYATRKRLLGHYHVDVISTLANQAQICSKLGLYKEGLDSMMKVYKWRQINLERTDPMILQSILVISDLKRKIGNLDDALTFNDLAIDILSKLNGPQSLELMERYAFAADIKKIQGQYNISEKLLRKVVYQFTETCGSNHPDTAQYMYLLATLLKKMGKYDEADRLYKLAFQSQIEIYGKDSPAAASTLNNIGVMYVDQDRFGDAEKLFTEALSIRRSAYGTDHPDIAASLNNLAGLYDIRGQYIEAKDLYEQSLKMRCRLFGKTHPAIAQSLNNLGNLKCSMGHFEDAQLFYNESLKILSETYGESHPDVASALNNIAGCFECMEQYERALPLYERSLTIRLNTFGPSHPAVAQSLNNLAGMRYRQGDHAGAIALYEQSMDIKMKLYGSENADVAESLNNIAVMHMEAGKYTSAVHSQEQAVQLLERLLGSDHPNTINVKGNLGISYKRMGVQALGEKLVKESLEYLTRHNYPVTHPWVRKFTLEVNSNTSNNKSKLMNLSGNNNNNNNSNKSISNNGIITSDSTNNTSSDSDRQNMMNQQKKSNFLANNAATVNNNFTGDRYITPGKIKRAPVKVTANITTPSPQTFSRRYQRFDSDGDVIDINDVKFLPSDESDDDVDDELDLEAIHLNDFLLTEDGSIDVEKALESLKSSKNSTTPNTTSITTGNSLTSSTAGVGKSPSRGSKIKSSSLLSNNNNNNNNNINNNNSDSNNSAVERKTNEVLGVEQVSNNRGSGLNSTSSRRTANRSNLTTEERLEKLANTSTSRQINVNIVDKTTRQRRPSGSSYHSDSSSTSPSRSDGQNRIVRPKSHGRRHNQNPTSNMMISPRSPQYVTSGESGNDGEESSTN